MAVEEEIDRLTDRIVEAEKEVALTGVRFEALKELTNTKFSVVNDYLEDIDSKLDDLRISVANRNGALNEAGKHARKQATIWSICAGIPVALITTIGVIFTSGACAG